MKATRGKDWKTLEALVRDLDRAGYWKGEPERNSVEKRSHVRKMLMTLVFRKDAPGPEGGGVPSLAGRHVFVSAMKAGDSGGLVRVYKQFLNLTSGELQDVLVDEEAVRSYRKERAARGGGLAYLSGDVWTGACLLELLTALMIRGKWTCIR